MMQVCYGLGGLLLCIFAFFVGIYLGRMLRGESPKVIKLRRLREEHDREYANYLQDLDTIDSRLIHDNTDEAKANNFECFEQRVKRMEDYSLYLQNYEKEIKQLI